MPGEIVRPCRKSWSDLEGDDRKRFCQECGRHVYAVERYSEKELAEMGPICGYIAGVPTPPASRRALMAGALLTTISPLLAQNGRVKVVVTATSGDALADAVVTVGGQTAKTDPSGAVVLQGLPAGRHVVKVESPGFQHWEGAANVDGAGETQVAAQLRVGGVGGYAAIAPPPAKGGYGNLQVTVTDALGAAAADTEVAVTCSGREAVRGRTDSSGAVTFSGLPVGNCQVSATRPDFQVWEGRHRVAGGETGRVAARLLLATRQEKIVVKESAGRRFMNWLTSCTRK